MNLWQKLVICFLFALGIFFALFRLSEAPPFTYDEGWYIQTAANLASTGIDGLQMAPGYVEHLSNYVSVGYPFIYGLAAWFKIFGASILSARWLMAVLLVASTLLAFVLALNEAGGPAAPKSSLAIGALALFATFPPLYGDGKAVLGEMPAIFLLIASLACLRSASTGSPHRRLALILAGAFAGLALATKTSFLLLAPALVVGAFVAWRRRDLAPREIGIVALAAAAPVAVWIFTQLIPGQSLADILSWYANPSHSASVGASVATNLKALFTDTSTLFTVGLIMVWIVGIAIRMRGRARLSISEVVAFSFAILTVLSFVRSVGFYRYLFPAQIMAVIYFPAALDAVLEWAGQRAAWLRPRLIWMSIISLLALVQLYQLGFHSYVADAYSSHAVADEQAYLDTIAATSTLYFYNTPMFVPLFHGRQYYQTLVLFNQADWMIGSEWLSVLRQGRADYAIVGTHPSQDDASGLLSSYAVVQRFDKVEIMKLKK